MLKMKNSKNNCTIDSSESTNRVTLHAIASYEVVQLFFANESIHKCHHAFCIKDLPYKIASFECTARVTNHIKKFEGPNEFMHEI